MVFFTYLAEHPEIVYDFIVFGLSIAAFVVSIVRGHSISQAVKNFEEVSNLKYKTATSARKDSAQHSQTFSEYVKDYVLNPGTNELEELEVPKNIQAKIDSYVNTALESALERFMPKVVGDDNTSIDYTAAAEDLAVVGDAMDRAEEYREKFNLPDTMTYKEIYDFIGTQAADLKKKLGEMNNRKELRVNAQSSETQTEQKV